MGESNALPVRFYGDPADIVERNELDSLGCHACNCADQVLGKLKCTDPRNESQKGVPRIGHHCRLFDERE